MKCPECGGNHKVKSGMKCGVCGYQFTFNPKVRATQGFTDGKFSACIQAASQNNTAWFTKNQLYAAYCRRTSKSGLTGVIWGILIVLLGIFATAYFAAPIGVIILVVGFAILFGTLVGIIAARRATRWSNFQEILQRWERSGKTIERLIEKPSLHEPPPDWSEPDIYEYGVERILLVEHNILVDLFVKNGVHAEQRMLVLSGSGYPDYLLPIARRLLEEKPDLPVFLLHDATTQGGEMEERVLSNGMFPLDGHPITDLGMFPTDFQKLKRTNSFDPENEHRALPVDAMMLPLLTVGLATATTQQMAFGAVIDEQQRRGGLDGGSSSFG
jgi:hypothetical protein